MTDAFSVRQAGTSDLSALLQLYLHLTPNNVPFPTDQAEEIFAAFQRYAGSAIFLGEAGGALVSSCAIIVIPNLTRGGAPYALVENVVTHADHRKRGYGQRVLDAACDHAWAHGCYKVMLMTGSNDASVLSFYHGAGFEQTKTGFQKRRVPARS